MDNSIVKYTVVFFMAGILQILLFSNITFMGFVSPYVYLSFLLILPVGLSRNWQMILGFVMGLCMDLSFNTPGIHAFACVLVGALRNTWIDSLFHIDFAMASPSVRTFGFLNYSKYAIGVILLHHTTIFLLESMSIQPFWLTLCRIMLNTVITFFLIICYELVRR